METILTLTQQHALKQSSLLCVEDDADTLALMHEFFSRYFGEVYTAESGEEGFEVFCKYSPDVVITDIVMPKGDGIWLTNQIRKVSSDVLIAFISGNASEKTLMKVIEVKPFDFLVKTITFGKLQLLISSIVKYIDTKSVILSDGIEIDFNGFTVKNSKGVEPLSPKEAKLLEILIDNSGTIVPYDKIEGIVWNSSEMTDDSLRSLIYRLRLKFEKKHIKVIYGEGIVFNK
jgi:DNA-binding response OmpR family regulator